MSGVAKRSVLQSRSARRREVREGGRWDVGGVSGASEVELRVATHWLHLVSGLDRPIAPCLPPQGARRQPLL